MAMSSEISGILTKLEDNLRTVSNQLTIEDLPNIGGERFNKDTFWENFIAAAKLVAHSATKLCLMFSKSPLPSKEESQALADNIESTCFSFVAVFFTLPKSRGNVLYKAVHSYVTLVLQSVKELCSAIKNESNAQLINVGSVWEECEAVALLPKDNCEAVIQLCKAHHDTVQDACEEFIDAMENDYDNNFSIPPIDGQEDMPPSSWTDSDRHVLIPCVGLIKAAKACLKKTHSTLSERGNGDNEISINELDQLANIIKRSSELVDDFVISLYPPMNHSLVRRQACSIKDHCKEVLACVRNSHLFINDEEWVTFLEKAVNHNWTKISDMALTD